MLLIRRLVWDEWNVAHIARHGVVPKEAEEVCQGPYRMRESYGGRLILIGPTDAGRMLAVILDPEAEEGTYYPITARPASRRERAIYQQERGGESR